MKRDDDLVRDVLLAVEADADSVDAIQRKLPKADPKLVVGHVELLWKAGFLSGADASSHDGFDLLDAELTWTGHEFLANARNDTVWQRAKKEVADKGGSVSLQVLQSLLGALAMKAVGL